MSEFKKSLTEMFGVKKAPTSSTPVPQLSDAPTPPKFERTMGNPFLTAQAQKIYDPNTPTPPVPSAPPATQVDQGQGPAMNGGPDAAGWSKMK